MTWSIDSEHGNLLCSGVEGRLVTRTAQGLADLLDMEVTAYSASETKVYTPTPIRVIGSRGTYSVLFGAQTQARVTREVPAGFRVDWDMCYSTAKSGTSARTFVAPLLGPNP